MTIMDLFPMGYISTSFLLGYKFQLFPTGYIEYIYLSGYNVVTGGSND